MKKQNHTNSYYKPKQLKLPLEIEKIIDISDPVYSFCEIVDCIDLNSYFAKEGCKKGRPRYNRTNLLKVILFSFMENGYLSLRGIEKSCKTDIRYMYLLDDMKAPTFATIGIFIRKDLIDTIENIFIEINKKINKEELMLLGIKFETRTEYAIKYVEEILEKYKKVLEIDESKFVTGKGKRKTNIQRNYEKLKEYKRRLQDYAKHIEICGEKRGSYSKTDKSATFMRIKKDYMGNDQLLPAYNLQIAVCGEYIATVDVKQYASDTDCFVPLMEKFMKFTMFEKETKNKK